MTTDSGSLVSLRMDTCCRLSGSETRSAMIRSTPEVVSYNDGTPRKGGDGSCTASKACKATDRSTNVADSMRDDDELAGLG